MRKIFILFVLFVFSANAFAAEYQIDSAHTNAGFSIRHLMISNVKGVFSGVKGSVSYDPNKLEDTKIEASIDVATIDTREKKRDDHLRSPEFFDSGKFPVMNFKSKKAEKLSDGKLAVLGDLTIRGITKEVTLTVDSISPEVKDPWGNTKIGASATTTLNRKDFGIVYNKTLETGGLLIGDDVTVTLEVELTKSA